MSDQAAALTGQDVEAALRSVNSYRTRNEAWMALLTVSAVLSVVISVLNVFKEGQNREIIAAWIAGLTALNASALAYYGAVKERLSQANKCKAALESLRVRLLASDGSPAMTADLIKAYTDLLSMYPDPLSYLKRSSPSPAQSPKA